MMNYIKSEFYRITHTIDIYIITGILVALTVLFHICTYIWGGQYRNTSFSYSNLVVSPMRFALMGAIIAFSLYESGHKNGNLKNTVAGGISRRKIFLGECIVGTAVSTAVMLIVLGVWVLSAKGLLEDRGPVQLNDLLMEVPMAYLVAVAGLVSIVVFMEVFEKSITVILVWAFVWSWIPSVLMYIGFRIDMVYDIAMWLPKNFFEVMNGMHVNTQECITAWDTAEGMVRCVLSGGIGVVIFMLSGIMLLKKKDL